MLSRALLKSVPQVQGALMQSRQMSVLSGPARVKLPLPVKLAHLAFIFGCTFTFPAWVLVNIKHYSSK